MNAIQQMLWDTGMLTIKLPVKHDKYEYDVVVNGVECTYCQTLEHADMIHSYEDVDMCDACYEHTVA